MGTRQIISHRTNDCNCSIEVFAHTAGSGGAPVRYDVFGPAKKAAEAGIVPSFEVNLKFQDGPVADGINGITNEVLLAILEDRLAAFQTGPFACRENNTALIYIRAAQDALLRRTRERQLRRVEGTHQP